MTHEPLGPCNALSARSFLPQKSTMVHELAHLTAQAALGRHHICQDAFDHDKGQRTAISGRPPPLDFYFLNFLEWMLFPFFSPGLLCNLVRKTSQNVEKSGRFPDREKKRRLLSHLWLSWVFGPESVRLHMTDAG